MVSKRSTIETQMFSTRELQQAADEIVRAAAAAEEKSKDLGFGSEVAGHTHRLINADGTFNVRRVGYNLLRSRSIYHALLNLRWPPFLGLVLVAYLTANLFFAVLYFACGPEAIAGIQATNEAGRFLDCFFFSVQTAGTIGYGQMTPVGIVPNLIVTAEALLSLLGFALATGLFFARFSRPTARILFSKNAVVVPHKDRAAFQLRLVNERKNQLMDLEARIIMSRVERAGGSQKRSFHELELDRDRVLFFPLNWTLSHTIDETSPLNNVTAEELRRSDAEFMVLITGMDDTFSQKVHAWRSYKFDEVAWGHRFTNILEQLEDGSVRIDLNRIHEIEPISNDKR